MESYSWLRRCMVQSLWEDSLDSLQNLAHALTTQHSNCTPYYRVFPWYVYMYIFDSLIDVLLYFSDLAHSKSKLLKVWTHFGDTLYVCKKSWKHISTQTLYMMLQQLHLLLPIPGSNQQSFNRRMDKCPLVYLYDGILFNDNKWAIKLWNGGALNVW